jgi:hypothetical protein
MSRYYRSFLEESGSAYTTRTTAFASATGIADTTILGALNTFDLGLISNGLDTKMKALYPLVGGTASTHKYNFMDARDLDVAFRLTFNGGWTHSSNGALGNGTNTIAQTHFNDKFNFVDFFKGGLGIYSRTNETGLYLEGNLSDGINCLMALYTKHPTLGIIFQTQGYTAAATSDSLGLIVGQNVNTSDKRTYKNGVKLVTDTTVVTAIASDITITFGSTNGLYVSNKSYGLMFIDEGMNDTDHTNFYNLVQTLQTSLSRQV